MSLQNRLAFGVVGVQQSNTGLGFFSSMEVNL